MAKFKAADLVAYNGKEQSISDWSNELGISRSTLVGRFNSGWDVDRALTIIPDRYSNARLAATAGKTIRERIRVAFLEVWDEMGEREWKRQLRLAMKEDALKTTDGFAQFIPKDTRESSENTIENLAIKIELAQPVKTEYVMEGHCQ